MPPIFVQQVRVMISSTRADLAQYREEASKIIRKLASEKEKRVELVEKSMERETQSGNREFAVEVSKRWVEESDWVVLIVGWNYGMISDEAGADGLSVTEWEFRHADQLGKKLFVFVTGDPDTADEYRVTAEEKKDLKDWVQKQTGEQQAKLQKFRKQLCARHVGMFANLQMFRECLEKTLRDELDNLTTEIEPGTPLADLIVEVTPEIRDCIKSVELTATCKQIHDCLHEILQYVIRPLREQVLSMWEQEEKLSEAVQKKVYRCINKAAEQRGTIRGVIKSLGSEYKVLRSVLEDVLNEIQKWMNMTDAPSWPARKDFAEALNNLAGLVESAFNEADQSMIGEESKLSKHYSKLLEGLKKARGQRNLGPDDRQRLDEEVQKVKANMERLSKKLAEHHFWQGVHNKFKELETYREIDERLFDKQFNLYRKSGLQSLLIRTDEELGQIFPNSPVSAEPPARRYCPREPTSSTAILDGCLGACVDFVDRMGSLKESLDGLPNEGGAVTFYELRRRFDDAFYCVDKTTLGECNGAEVRAVVLEKWLNGLIAVQQSSR